MPFINQLRKPDKNCNWKIFANWMSYFFWKWTLMNRSQPTVIYISNNNAVSEISRGLTFQIWSLSDMASNMFKWWINFKLTLLAFDWTAFEFETWFEHEKEIISKHPITVLEAKSRTLGGRHFKFMSAQGPNKSILIL